MTLLVWWSVCGEYPMKWVAEITSHRLHSPPGAFPLLLPKHREYVCGTYVCAAKSFHCIYFANSRKKQRMFCWGGGGGVSASVIPINLPSVPAYGSPRCQATGNEVFVSPEGGMKRGICFTSVGDKAAERLKEGRKKKRGRKSLWGNKGRDEEQIGSNGERDDQKWRVKLKQSRTGVSSRNLLFCDSLHGFTSNHFSTSMPLFLIYLEVTYPAFT